MRRRSVALLLLSVAACSFAIDYDDELQKAIEEVDEEVHSHVGDHAEIHIFSTDLEKHSTFLMGAALIIIIALTRSLVHHVKFMSHSLTYTALGFVIGAILHMITDREFYLPPEIFFSVMLPLIAFDAVYFMKASSFFHHLIPILVFAFIGTIFNTFFLTLLLSTGQNLYMNTFPPRNYSTPVDTLDLGIFSAICAAVDPVAVLAIFDELHVNEQLYITVFGESILNDAVTIVIYHSLTAMKIIGLENITLNHVVSSLLQFFSVSIFGTGIGVLGGFATTLLSRLPTTDQFSQPNLILTATFLIYHLSEALHFSGILATVGAVIVIKHYIAGNVVTPARVNLTFLSRQMASISEELVFVMLGISLFNHLHQFDVIFILLTNIGAFVIRFVGVFFFTAIINYFRHPSTRYSLKDQFIIAFGGLRGAVGYGLVMSINDAIVPAKYMFMSSTVSLIVVTTFIQGIAIKYCIKCLSIRQKAESESVFNEFFKVGNEHLLNFMEVVAGVKHYNIFYRSFITFDEVFLKRWLMLRRVTRGQMVVEQQNTREMEKVASTLFSPTSYAGLPSIASQTTFLTVPHSHSMTAIAEHAKHAEHVEANENHVHDNDEKTPLTIKPISPPIRMPPRSAPQISPRSPVPRNESFNKLVNKAFTRRSTYRRHAFDFDAAAQEAEEEELETTKTYPYPGSVDLAKRARQLSMSMRGAGRLARNAISPHRRQSMMDSRDHNSHAPRTLELRPPRDRPRRLVDRSVTIAEEEPAGEIRRRFTIGEEDEEEEENDPTSPSFHLPNKVRFHTEDETENHANEKKEQKTDRPSTSNPSNPQTATKTPLNRFMTVAVHEDLHPIDEEADGDLSPPQK